MRPRPLLALALLAGLPRPAPAQDLVLHIAFDEASGTTATDVSGNGYDALLTGGFLLGQPGAPETASQAVSLDGDSGGGRISNGPSLDALLADFTVAAWVRADLLGPWQRIFSNAESWGFGFGGDRVVFSTHDVFHYVSSFTVNEGVWMHLAAVMDANALVTLYADGVPLDVIQGTGPANPPANNWWVGSKTGAFELFEGTIDDLQVYEGALSDAEVAFLHEHGAATVITKSNFCTLNPNSTGQPARIDALGSGSVALNTLRLQASPVPNQNGIFFYGPAVQLAPFGNGFLCIAPPFGRLPIELATNNELVHELDNTQPPNAATQITPGSTWYFQAWFRDPAAGGAAFNLSDGLEALFTP